MDETSFLWLKLRSVVIVNSEQKLSINCNEATNADNIKILSAKHKYPQHMLAK